MQLSVIIVSYNVKYYLWQCLYSLGRALQGIDAEVIVFDNHSKDGTVDFLFPLFPRVTFISSNHNLGFARANNHAIRQSQGDYVLMLNPDTIVGEDTLQKALAFMHDHPNTGALGVRMMNADGTDAPESRRGVPTPMTAFYKMSGLCRLFPGNHHFGRYYMGWLPWEYSAQIEIVSGACCLLRREALMKVGMLDEDFFMYGEDIDLSYRLLKAGWENWYLPCRILHYKGESTQKSSFRYVHVFYKAMLIFFQKHYGHLKALITIPVKAAIYVKALAASVSMMLHKAHKSLGFVPYSVHSDTLYAFYVAPKNLVQCQSLADHKGLWAEFHDANKSRMETIPIAHKSQKSYIVYDTTAYSFNEMLARFSTRAPQGALLATYYPEKNMIITDSDVIV